MHEVKGCSWSGLSNKGDVGGNEVGCVDLVNEDSGLKVVSFSEEAIKGVCELGGKDDRFPFCMVSSDVEMGHGVMEPFTKVGVRCGRSRGLGAFG